MTSPGGTEHPEGAKIKPILEKRVMWDAQGNRVEEPRPFHQIPDANRFGKLQTGTGQVIGWVPTDAPKEDKKRAREAAYDAEYQQRPNVIARRQTDAHKKRRAAYDVAYQREIRAGKTAEEARAEGWAAQHWVDTAWEESQAVAQASPKDVDTRRQQVELQLQHDQNLLKYAESSPLAAQYLHLQGLTQETLRRRITASEARLDGIAAGQVELQLRQDQERLKDITSSPIAAQYWQGHTQETLQQSIAASEARLNELMTPRWLRWPRETEDGRASS